MIEHHDSYEEPNAFDPSVGEFNQSLLKLRRRQPSSQLQPTISEHNHQRSKSHDNDDETAPSLVVPIYVGLSAVIWAVYFTIRYAIDDVAFIVSALLATFCAIMCAVERAGYVQKWDESYNSWCRHETKENESRSSKTWTTPLTTLIMCFTVLLSLSAPGLLSSESVKFAWTVQVIIIIYTCVPQKSLANSVLFSVCTACAVIFSIIAETMMATSFCLEQKWMTESKQPYFNMSLDTCCCSSVFMW